MAKKIDTFKHINNDRYNPFCLERIDSICSGYMLTEMPLEKEICKNGNSSLPSETTDCKQMQQDMEPTNTSIDNIEVLAEMVEDENLGNKNDNLRSIQTNKGDVVCIACAVITVILLFLLLVFYVYIMITNKIISGT